MNFKLVEYVHHYIVVYCPSEKIGLKWSILVQGTPWFCLDDIKKMYIHIDEDIVENDKGQPEDMGNGKVIIKILENAKKE